MNSMEQSIDDPKFKTLKPDHGVPHVPGAPPTLEFSPQSLDHFKRGYKERAILRDKEHYSENGNDELRPQNRPVYQENRYIHGLDMMRTFQSLIETRDVFTELDRIYHEYPDAFSSGKAMTALIAMAARERNIRLAHDIWYWMDRAKLEKNIFHYNSMISVAEKARNFREGLDLMREMDDKRVSKNEVTYSSCISACEKSGEWRVALDLLDKMEEEGIQKTSVAYNAAISACEKGIVPQKACEVFTRMKKNGIKPTVVSYSALISAAEKGSQWRLALEILDEMKTEGFTANVVAYSAAISALAKGQQWEKALELFREIQNLGGQPSIVTYNATMTALEKGLQWERALGLFEEMKMKNMPITVVSYGSAISACDKGLQYRQCLEYLDEMTDMGIEKNVIIFGAAMSCMEKCCRADISFQLMERMKIEGIVPNVHIYNSAISACARCNLWAKGYELFKEMDVVGVNRDVVTYNAVLDAVCSQIQLGRTLFQEGVEKGFYARVSRLATHWFELDLHFLSLGGGEIALGWWLEDCLVPYFMDTSKLQTVTSISIVTGYGKTRTRGRRQGDDGMKKRVSAMLGYMNIYELPQENAGRIHIDKDRLVEEVKRNGGKISFDLNGYLAWKDRETTASFVPNEEQKIRARFKPAVPGSGKPPFVRVETEATSPEYRLDSSGTNEADRRNFEEDKRRVAEGIQLEDRVPERRNRTDSAFRQRASRGAHYKNNQEHYGNGRRQDFRKGQGSYRDGSQQMEGGPWGGRNHDRKGRDTDYLNNDMNYFRKSEQHSSSYDQGERGGDRGDQNSHPRSRDHDFNHYYPSTAEYDRHPKEPHHDQYASAGSARHHNHEPPRNAGFQDRFEPPVDRGRNGYGPPRVERSRDLGPQMMDDYRPSMSQSTVRHGHFDSRPNNYHDAYGDSVENRPFNRKRGYEEFQRQQPNRGYNIQPPPSNNGK